MNHVPPSILQQENDCILSWSSHVLVERSDCFRVGTVIIKASTSKTIRNINNMDSVAEGCFMVMGYVFSYIRQTNGIGEMTDLVDLLQAFHKPWQCRYFGFQNAYSEIQPGTNQKQSISPHFADSVETRRMTQCWCMAFRQIERHVPRRFGGLTVIQMHR